MKKSDLSGCIAAIAVALLIAGAFYLSYASYKERYPNAAWWSYFFKK